MSAKYCLTVETNRFCPVLLKKSRTDRFGPAVVLVGGCVRFV